MIESFLKMPSVGFEPVGYLNMRVQSQICLSQVANDSADNSAHHGENQEKENTQTTVFNIFLFDGNQKHLWFCDVTSTYKRIFLKSTRELLLCSRVWLSFSVFTTVYRAMGPKCKVSKLEIVDCMFLWVSKLIEEFFTTDSFQLIHLLNFKIVDNEVSEFYRS